MSRKNLERGPRKARIHNRLLLLPLELVLYRSFEIGCTQIGFFRRGGGHYFAEMRDVFDRLLFAIRDNLQAAFIRSHVESAMHNADEWDELTAVVLDEKDIFVADPEFRRVAHGHRLASNGATEHANGVRLARITLERLFNLKSDIAHDIALRAFSNTFRFHIGDMALKDNVGFPHKFVEARRNDGGGGRAAHDCEHP